MRDAFTCDGIRILTGRYGGASTGIRTDDLATIPLRELLSRNPGPDPVAIDDVIPGYANQIGEDNRNITHIATLLAGHPHSVSGTTINRSCGPGLDAIGFAVRVTKAGDVDPLIVGGVESMSCVPFVMGKASTPCQRQSEFFDTTVDWHFVNPLMARHLGTDNILETTEGVAELLNISRADQDALAWRSQQRTEQAQRDGTLVQEIVPVQIIGKKRAAGAVRDDEHPRPKATLEQLAKLKAPSRQGGVTTVGDASGVSDGAAAPIIASEQQVAIQGLMLRARIVVMATAGVEPHLMGLGPVSAARKALERAELNTSDMDLIELNKALAAQALGVLRQFGVPDDVAHVNPNDGAIALDHPLSMSGARLALSTSLELQRRGGRYALCTMRIGMGQDIAMVLERV